MDPPIPPLLNQLIAAGRWPANGDAARKQNLEPLVSRERVRKFAPEEDLIYLQPPPFHTIAKEVAAASAIAREFWERDGALDQIDPEKSLILGDFGLGSDAPIILNYAADPDDPPVFRLRWRGQKTDWVPAARNFAEFASLLGLTGGAG